jgi:carbon monoxide dehydrogenase subunit G
MDMTGEIRLPASREAVWARLNDPETLKAAIPGCEELVQLSPTEMTASVTTKIGPIKARFKGKVTLSELDPPNGYKLTGEGQGGVAGFASGGAIVRLEAISPDETLLRYEASAKVGGKIAQLGSRLVDSTAKKLAAEFFDNFAKIVGPAEG